MTDFILHALASGGYLGIFLLMALENIVPPIPSEVIMGLAGMAVARGQLAFVPLVLVATAGTTAGNYFWYWLGRHIGYQRFRPFVERYGRWLTLDWPGVERLHALFVRHGGWVIFVLRFMPAFRTIVSLPAGMTRMPPLRFFLYTFAGSVIWNAILAWAGLYFGNRFGELHRYVGPATLAVFGVIIAGYAWRVAPWRPES